MRGDGPPHSPQPQLILEGESGKTGKPNQKVPWGGKRRTIETAYLARRLDEGHLKPILEDEVARGPQPTKELERLPIAGQEKVLAVIHRLFRGWIDEGAGPAA